MPQLLLKVIRSLRERSAKRALREVALDQRGGLRRDEAVAPQWHEVPSEGANRRLLGHRVHPPLQSPRAGVRSAGSSAPSPSSRYGRAPPRSPRTAGPKLPARRQAAGPPAGGPGESPRPARMPPSSVQVARDRSSRGPIAHVACAGQPRVDAAGDAHKIGLRIPAAVPPQRDERLDEGLLRQILGDLGALRESDEVTPHCRRLRLVPGSQVVRGRHLIASIL